MKPENPAGKFRSGVAVRLILLVASICLYAACTTTDNRYYSLSPDSKYYRVKAGDTLYGIARRSGKPSLEIARWNGISKPYRLAADTILALVPPPGEAQKSVPPVVESGVQIQSAPGPAAVIPEALAVNETPAATKLPEEKKVVANSASNTPKEVSETRKPPPAASPEEIPDASKNRQPPPSIAETEKNAKKSKKNLKVHWMWPLKGVIARNFSQTGRKGLDIVGKYGTPVKAAAAGEILFGGKGVSGYGFLVILQHGEGFVSAYGNNSRLLVTEGDRVRKGQAIAELGVATDKRAMLHFEIRRNGKPVNPVMYLPKP